jgi:hypothetical protein
LTHAKLEVDELKVKVNCEYTEKMNDLDILVKNLKDEIRKRDSDIKNLTDDQLKGASSSSKKQALLEQEMDFIKSEL